jgi:glycosyltransferase involved in cell wall biosynthesis
MTKTLDLGCGSKPKNPFNADEFYGVDIRDDLEANIRKADLAIEPIPYENQTFEYVTAYDFIEHIPRIIYVPKHRNAFIEFMNEVYRVLKPGGLFLSSTPAYPHAVAFRDPTHVNFITDETFPLYFDDSNRWASGSGFTGAFRIVTHEWRGPHIFAVLEKVPVPVPHEAVTDANRKVSVIVPVFNGEKYIADTIDSLLKQTLTDFEIICVDDRSTDASLSVLQAYAEKDQRVRVFQTHNNMGFASKVVNYALQFMQGAYFVYSSQDDVFSTDCLEKMRTRAIETDADAVIPDVVFYYANDASKNRTLTGLRGDRNIELSNREAVLYSLNWEIPGNALLNANLIKKFGFEEFGMNSDEYSARVFFMNCNKVVFSEGSFFYRQDNELAVTKKTTYKTFDYPYTQFRLYQLLRDNQFPAEVVQQAALKVIEIMTTLKQWLTNNRAELSPEDLKKAEARIKKCMDCLKGDQMFSQVLQVI